MIYITYYKIKYTKDKFIVDKYDGPYLEKFNNSDLALEWVKSTTDIEIVNIDHMR